MIGEHDYEPDKEAAYRLGLVGSTTEWWQVFNNDIQGWNEESGWLAFGTYHQGPWRVGVSLKSGGKSDRWLIT